LDQRLRRARQHLDDRLDQLGHFRQPTRTGFAAFGHLTDVGTDEGDAVGLELGNVAPSGRMQPHARVHGGCDQHRLVGGHQHAGCKVIRMPACHLGEQVGGGRCDDDQIGFAGQADVADLALVVEIEQFGEHAVVGERADRQRRDELMRGLRHDRTNGNAVLAQPPDQIEALVGCNAAADDEQHPMGWRRLPGRGGLLAALAGHVAAHAIGRLERNAAALAQLGNEVAVVDGRHAELAGRYLELRQETSISLSNALAVWLMWVFYGQLPISQWRSALNRPARPATTAMATRARAPVHSAQRVQRL
jgi:hypothetical protein